MPSVIPASRRCYTVTWTRNCLGEEPLRDVRQRARQWLVEHEYGDDLVDTVELVIAELAANAVEHGGCLTALSLDIVPPRTGAPGALRVSAHDPSPQLPCVGREACGGAGASLRECGRGLEIVAAVSHAWGAARDQGRHKHVWCELLVPQLATDGGNQSHE